MKVASNTKGLASRFSRSKEVESPRAVFTRKFRTPRIGLLLAGLAVTVLLGSSCVRAMVPCPNKHSICGNDMAVTDKFCTLCLKTGGKKKPVMSEAKQRKIEARKRKTDEKAMADALACPNKTICTNNKLSRNDEFCITCTQNGGKPVSSAELRQKRASGMQARAQQAGRRSIDAPRSVRKQLRLQNNRSLQIQGVVTKSSGTATPYATMLGLNAFKFRKRNQPEIIPAATGPPPPPAAALPAVSQAVLNAQQYSQVVLYEGGVQSSKLLKVKKKASTHRFWTTRWVRYTKEGLIYYSDKEGKKEEGKITTINGFGNLQGGDKKILVISGKGIKKLSEEKGQVKEKIYNIQFCYKNKCRDKLLSAQAQKALFEVLVKDRMIKQRRRRLSADAHPAFKRLAEMLERLA